MSIINRDLKVIIMPSNPNLNILENTVGCTSSFNIHFSNLSTITTLYNLTAKLTLPDGLTFVNSPVLPNKNSIDSNFNNIITFINIGDICCNQSDIVLEITYKLEEYYRGDLLPIVYDSFIDGICVDATVRTTTNARENTSNDIISNSDTISLRAYRFQILYNNLPNCFLKGAGSTPSDTAINIFTISLTLQNSTRDLSTVSLYINLANGLRYLNNWTSTGHNCSNFNSPTIISPKHPNINNYSLSIINQPLSIGSQTTISFNVSIWNNLTLGGFENTGSFIYNGQILTTTSTLSGNNTFYSQVYKVSALQIQCIKELDILNTDINTVQTHTLIYKIDSYSTISNSTITEILPDGLHYIDNSSTLIPSSFNYDDVTGESSLTWYIESLPPNYTSSISFNTQTLSTYINETSIHSGDTFKIDTLINAIYLFNNSTLTSSASLTLSIKLPRICVELLGYYDSHLNLKLTNVGTTDDYIKLKVTYDATDVKATQHYVELFNYCPETMNIQGILNLALGGNIPENLNLQFIGNNGVFLNFEDLNGCISFYFTGYIPIVGSISPSKLYNFGKINLLNSYNKSFSINDALLLYFGTPCLNINSSTSQLNTIVFQDNISYMVTINNLTDIVDEQVYVTDSYNLEVITTIPSIFTINETPILTGNATFEILSLTNNIFTMFISNLPPSNNLEIIFNLTVSTIPLLGDSYNLITTISNGTSQQDINSYRYSDNNNPLSSSVILSTANIEIFKYYSNPIISLGDYYTAYLDITIPQGILAYNPKIKDSLVTTDTTYFSDILLNNATPSYSILGNTIEIPLMPIMDTTNATLHYILQYSHRVITANPTNYQDIKTTTGEFTWSQSLNDSTIYTASANCIMTTIVPEIEITKYQQNQSRGGKYDTAPIVCSDYDLISYKISLNNVGKANAIDIVLTDTLPSTLLFDSFSDTLGNFNPQTYVVTVTLPLIEANTLQDVIINTIVANDSQQIITTNIASSVYKANSNLSNNYGKSESNTITLYKNLVALIKYQRNLTLEEEFSTEATRCFLHQQIQIKLIIENPLESPLTNVVITDNFPLDFIYVSNGPFDNGIITNSGCFVSATIPFMPSNSTIAFIYTIELINEIFTRVSSKGSISYKISSSQNILTAESNTTYTLLASLGKGFKIY